MLKILVVEDEKPISNLIYTHLSKEGYQCVQAFDGKQAADLLEATAFDMVLLDIMLPEVDGYELLEYIKPIGIPVLFISAKGELSDRIKGLRLGADDYIVKPFQVGELSARIEAVLRRYGKSQRHLEVLDIQIDVDARQVFQQGKVVDLTVKEFDLLIELVRNKNVALHREKLYERVWNEPFTGETRTLDSHMLRLRKKLSWENHIKTVFRIGYRLEV